MTEKTKLTIYIAPETKDLIRDNYKAACCRNMSRFVEKSVLFYSGYINAQHAEYYLPDVLKSVLQTAFGLFGDRIGKLLFKLAVENNIGNHILAADTDMDVLTYEKLRGRSVREVQQTNGKISFKDDLIFQKSL